MIDSREILEIAEGWLEDCFEDMPEDLSPREIWSAIQRHYEGGVKQFVFDGIPNIHLRIDKWGIVRNCKAEGSWSVQRLQNQGRCYDAEARGVMK